MTRKLLLCLCLTATGAGALAAPGGLLAQELDDDFYSRGRWIVDMEYGAQLWDDETVNGTEIETDTTNLNVSLGYAVRDNLVARVVYQQIDEELPSFATQRQVDSVSLGLSAYLFEEGYVRPFVAIGGGLGSIEQDGLFPFEDDLSSAFAQVGLSFPLGPHVALELSYLYTRIYVEDDDPEVFRLLWTDFDLINGGLTFSF